MRYPSTHTGTDIDTLPHQVPTQRVTAFVLLYRLYLGGADSGIGLPFCCIGPTVHINLPPRSCSEVELHLSYEEYSAFINEINSILKYSHVPMCPCALFPLGVICSVVYARHKRTSSISRAVKAANIRIKSQGMQWYTTIVSCTILKLYLPYASLIVTNEITRRFEKTRGNQPVRW